MNACTSISFSGHALRRMFERSLSRNGVVAVIEAGEAIMDYPDDRPYPSQLRLGWVQGRAVHVVVAQAPEDYACYVVTAYYPSPEIWSDDFRTRRQ